MRHGFRVCVCVCACANACAAGDATWALLGAVEANETCMPCSACDWRSKLICTFTACDIRTEAHVRHSSHTSSSFTR